jgi:hypothetical protein
MFRHIAAGTAIAIAVTLTPSLAQAQQLLCGERDKILTKLGTDYAESQVSLGLASNGNLLEVMASPGGTWTMIFTKPEGGSCILATGRSWEKLTRAIPRRLKYSPICPSTYRSKCRHTRP